MDKSKMGNSFTCNFFETQNGLRSNPKMQAPLMQKSKAIAPNQPGLVKEAVKSLQTQKSLHPLKFSDGLALVAQKQCEEEALLRGDRRSVYMRARMYGTIQGEMVSNIYYGAYSG